MEYISFTRLFTAVSLILVYVIQKLVGLAQHAPSMNLKPIHDTIDVGHLAFDHQQQQSIDSVLAGGVVFMIIVSIACAFREAELYLKAQTKSSQNDQTVNAKVTHPTTQLNIDKKTQHTKKSIKRRQPEDIRRSSSISNSEKVPNLANKSLGQADNKKTSTNTCTPMFQYLTNVIASPPPPLPSFEYDYNGEEFKQTKGKKSSRRSHIIAANAIQSDDLGTNGSLLVAIGIPAVQTNNNNKSSSKSNSKNNGVKLLSSINSIPSPEFVPNQQNQVRRLDNPSQQNNALNTAILGSSVLGQRQTVHNNQVSSELADQQFVMPIRPPNFSSSLSSTSSSSSSSATTALLTPSSSSSTSSSASSSPPLPESAYGEYSLLGPGVTFELPCLRVRSAQSYTLCHRLK